MKLITKSDDNTTCLFKVDKMEDEVIQYIIHHDDVFNQKFDVMSNGSECVIIQKPNVSMSVEDCVGYLNHCFANEILSTIIRGEKIKKIRNK